ncbi:MAG TPA: tandem-95 repeat protein [Steroidobacteraceae bacterium]|nr:tandem-95 repeat protein [Steroidobacteraceae bacterium]
MQSRSAARIATVSLLALLDGCSSSGGPYDNPPPPPPANRAPTLTTNAMAATEDTPASLQIVASDPDGQTLIYAISGSAQHGTATISNTGMLSYTPAANYNGADTVNLVINDGAGAQVTGAIAITVAAVNDDPVSHDDALRVAVVNGQDILIDVVGNDTDVDGQPLTPVIVTQPRGGTLSVDTATRKLKFAPQNDYIGPIDFTYRASDGAANSAVASVRAVIGAFESLIFLSDYTTPGKAEVHVYDGLDVRRASDDLPAGGTLTSFTLSGNLSTLFYTVQGTDADRVYSRPLDGSSGASLRYTSAAKSNPAVTGIAVTPNFDASYFIVNDGWASSPKQFYVVNTSTGAKTRVAENEPGILELRFVQFNRAAPTLLMIQAQTAGTVPMNGDEAMTAFTGTAADARTLTQIGRTYAMGQHGSGEGLFSGADPRFIFHTEYRRYTSPSASVINFLAYDRNTSTEIPLVRTATPPDMGGDGVPTMSRNLHKLCFNVREPSTTTVGGPSKFYVLDTSNPNVVTAATPIVSAFTSVFGCRFASDEHTMIYFGYDAGLTNYKAYRVDSANPATPVLVAPAGETTSEQGTSQIADGAMRVAIAYFDSDGQSGILDSEVGRYWSVPLDGSAPFLFADAWSRGLNATAFFDSNEDGSFILNGRKQSGRAALEILSTRGLNLSIPVSKSTETIGMLRARWVHSSPYNF